MNKYLLFFLFIFPLWSCQEHDSDIADTQRLPDAPFVVILGTVQDAGSPHIGCKKDCCKALFDNPDPTRQVVSLGVVDPAAKRQYIFEATPDFSRQTEMLNSYSLHQDSLIPDGIFLTHAHIGHYTGLMYLGKEAKSAHRAKVYAMPQMTKFLSQNGPWSQLVTNKNIDIKTLENKMSLTLSDQLTVVPFLVPHRDEYSETAGYKIIGPNKSALFIPDIDKWERWTTDIVKEIGQVDYAFVDATFYNAAEVAYRDINLIPHPFVVETMTLFADLPDSEKAKIRFIHFNHTNPLLDQTTDAYRAVLDAGFGIAEYGDVIAL